MPIALFTNVGSQEPQLFLIEMQGVLEHSIGEGHIDCGKDLVMISVGDTPQLRLGHQLLEGKRVKLEKPLLLIKVGILF